MEQTRTDDASRFPSRCYFFPPHTSFLRLLSSPSLRERPSASRSSPTKGDREAGRRSSQSPSLHPSLP
ncbi:hypothetical protein OPV22_026024 [Ensete ventricosum]|uniref:Uncharacterized protein n=1 Tax=Ensete ventricosum TaxID=4639 RepID=A0AAV8Q917_ENSVE|nr:hypothetical protein OPV22_026024 [Ensete ventricosum]